MPERSGAPVKVGLMLPTGESEMAGATARWNNIKTMVLQAEAGRLRLHLERTICSST
jgi:hypothetical protein